jgi:hypothetical protein
MREHAFSRGGTTVCFRWWCVVVMKMVTAGELEVEVVLLFFPSASA